MATRHCQNPKAEKQVVGKPERSLFQGHLRGRLQRTENASGDTEGKWGGKGEWVHAGGH